MLESYRQLFALFPDALFVEDAAGVILEANVAAANMLAIPHSKLIGRNSSEFMAPGSLERISPTLKSLHHDETVQLDARYRAAGGASVDVDLHISLIPWLGEGDFPKGGAKADSAYLLIARPCGSSQDVERELRVLREAAGRSPFGLDRALFYVTSQNSIIRYSHLGASTPGSRDANSNDSNGDVSRLDWVANLVLSSRLKSALERAWAGEDVLLAPAWHSKTAVPSGANLSGAMAAVAEEAQLQAGNADARQYWLRLAFWPLRSDNAVTGVLVQAVDWTPQRIEEEKSDVSEAQRLLSLVTSSIHHELNNYLSVIIAQASAMRMAAPQGQLPPPNIGAIVDAGQEAVAVLRRSAEFIGRVEGAIAETDLNSIVVDSANLLRHILPQGFRIVVELGVDLPKVLVDERLMRTMILVLARHLQSRLTGGALTLRTFLPEQAHPSLLQAGFSIEDLGSRAVTASNAAPARTAGGSSESINLMLARAIARFHRAQLEILPKQQGTVMEFNLPGVDRHSRDGGGSAAPPGRAARSPNATTGTASQSDAFLGLTRTAHEGPRPRDGNMLPNSPFENASSSDAADDSLKCILIADDEENFRTFMGWALRQHGYEVILAANGQEAFERFQESPTRICLAILDAYMPLMGGLESYLRMQVLRPELPVLFASGFVRGPSVETLIDGCPGPAHVLLKPFSAEDLLKAVEEALAPKPVDE